MIKLPSNGIKCEVKYGDDEGGNDSKKQLIATIKCLLVATNCFKDSFCVRKLRKRLESWKANLDDLKSYVANGTGLRSIIVPLGCLFSELLPQEQNLVTTFSNFNFEDDEQRDKYCHDSIQNFISDVLTYKEGKLVNFSQGTDLVALYKKLDKLSLLPCPAPTAWGDYVHAFLHLYKFNKRLSSIVHDFYDDARFNERQLFDYIDIDALYLGWIGIENYQKNVKHNHNWEISGFLPEDPATLDTETKQLAAQAAFPKEIFKKLGVDPLIKNIRQLDIGVTELYNEGKIDIKGQDLTRQQENDRSMALKGIHALFNQWVTALGAF